ncbi:AMP-dependent synthetase/ligase [Nocardia sp. NPDC059246]|uniref:AMP-dependent synthetase/ligase n=1 Tax=unclassified Nocardia TaxID=2637762 RepID=UPI0036C9A967
MASTFAAASATLCQAFQATVARDPHAVAVRTTGNATTLTFAEWGEQVEAMAAGLAGLGVGREDTVALMMTNRPEFYPADVAVQHLGAAAFSVYNTNAPEQIGYALADSAAKVVICESQYLPNIRAGLAGTKVEHLVCIDGEHADTMTIDQLIARREPEFDFEKSWRAVQPGDIATLIYTSGTTGDPKGVQITHANMIAMIDGVEQIWASDPADRVISFLPSAHIADRVAALYHLMVVGNQVTTVSDRRDFAAALTDVHPTIFGAVPQIWQKLKATIEAELSESTGVKSAVAQWALRAGRRVSDAELDNRAAGPVDRAQYAVADTLVLSKLRAAVGLDSLKLAVSAAAPLAEEFVRFFNGIGIPLCDGWGMSELAGIITMSPKGQVRAGTVGRAVPGADIAIAEDGEVLVRGPMAMKSYLNKPEQTRETVDPDGWVHTGDIGRLDADGYLSIIDRKKELIINAGGKNMSPTNIENHVKAFSPLIAQAVAIGNNRKYNVALIVLDPDAVAPLCAKTGLPVDPEILAKSAEVLREIDLAVAAANGKLARVEQIKKYTIVPEFWQPGSDVLTPTLKLRRRPIDQRYAAIIDAMYE